LDFWFEKKPSGNLAANAALVRLQTETKNLDTKWEKSEQCGERLSCHLQLKATLSEKKIRKVQKNLELFGCCHTEDFSLKSCLIQGC
jgi:hypothetical protein